tara:strand:- start:623 stop:1039 length:417 start_codon:yes stop_codon:yes gene_type:complete
MNTDILLPIFYLAIFTFIVQIVQSVVRGRAVSENKHTPEEMFGIPLPENSSDLIKRLDRNHTNLFEYTVLFYAACISIFAAGKVDGYFILLANAYVVLRVIHSFYHILSNSNFGIRALVWLASNIVMLWMWFRLVMMF